VFTVSEVITVLLCEDYREYVCVANYYMQQPHLLRQVDGFGSRLFMDDANIPSLLSLPYLGLLDLPSNRYEPLLSLSTKPTPLLPDHLKTRFAPLLNRLSEQQATLLLRSPSLSSSPSSSLSKSLVGVGAYDWPAAYAATRPLLLEPETNPWFFRQQQQQQNQVEEGEAGEVSVVVEGIGGPHVG
jgi:meiotically up-regulated gene 157 (Mug157) protein